MFRIIGLSCVGFALLIGASMSAGPANAVVYARRSVFRRAALLDRLL
jgi:hypothetical protein